MARMTGASLFAEMLCGYSVTHTFFVPAFMLKAFAELETARRHGSTRLQLDVVSDTYAIADKPWTPSGREFHASQKSAG